MHTALPIDIHHLLAERTVESLRFEYKSAWNHVTGSSALQTICAFANDLAHTNGGYLILGVREEGGVPAVPAEGIPAQEVEAMQRAVHGAIRRIEPAYHPTAHAIEVEGRWVIVVHCPAGDAAPYDCPESLAKGAGRRRYVRVGAETKEALGALERQLLEGAARIPFDDRACLDAKTEDLSPDLFWHHLRQSGSRLGERRDDVRAGYRAWRLLRGTNGHEVPRNVAVLFFAEEPRRWIPGVFIEVAQLPGGRAGPNIVERTFEGPLPGMLRAALDFLRGLLPVKVTKHADRAEADRVDAWPFAAVEEALVNAVLHRGYDVPDPIKVEILPESLRVISYPGPVPGVTNEALASGELGAVPARNRRIAELLKEVDLAEARGTGVARIRETLERNGSPPPGFRFDEDRTYFEVILPIHPAFRAEEGNAQPLRVGRPAPAAEVIGRDELVEELLRAAEHGNALLVGPSGRGGTSVLNLLESRIGGRCVRLDLDGLDSNGILAALAEWRAQIPGAPSPTDKVHHRSSWVRFPIDQVIDATFDAPTTLLVDNFDASLDDGPAQESKERLLLGLLDTGPNLKVVAYAHRIPDFGDDRGPELLRRLRLVPLPPLAEAASRTLAERLLRGVGVAPEPALVTSLATLAAGLPSILHTLVREVHVRRIRDPEALELCVDELLVEPGDPTGLRERVEAFRARNGWVRGGYGPPHLASPPASETRILTLIGAAAEDVRRLDLIGRAVSSGMPRLPVIEELRRLELDGWVVEVDGALRFEHPLVRQEWLAGQVPRSVATSSPQSPPDDDIPF